MGNEWSKMTQDQLAAAVEAWPWYALRYAADKMTPEQKEFCIKKTKG
jgi:hypothetical protein